METSKAPLISLHAKVGCARSHCSNTRCSFSFRLWEINQSSVGFSTVEIKVIQCLLNLGQFPSGDELFIYLILAGWHYAKAQKKKDKKPCTTRTNVTSQLDKLWIFVFMLNHMLVLSHRVSQAPMLHSVLLIDEFLMLNVQPTGEASETRLLLRNLWTMVKYFLSFCVLTLCPSSIFLWETSA